RREVDVPRAAREAEDREFALLVRGQVRAAVSALPPAHRDLGVLDGLARGVLDGALDARLTAAPFLGFRNRGEKENRRDRGEGIRAPAHTVLRFKRPLTGHLRVYGPDL